MSVVTKRAMGQVARIPKGIVWNNVKADLVLFNSNTGAYHALDAVGSSVWRAIAENEELDRVIETLALQYAADRETVARDVAEFVLMSRRLGLLDVEEPSGG